jgi:pyruvate dehydrogenase E2 component (dihydrolipoamide acetyltransferase)
MLEVIMPKMGDGMEEGTLVEWLKKDGDKVKSGEVIGSIQTDKATLELESPGSGILTGFLISDGETVPVGVPIAAILKAGEALPEGWGKGATSKTESVPEVKETVAVEPTSSESVAATTSGRVKASPLAKKIAKENDIDLGIVQGSGPGGRIVERDVQAMVGKAPATQPVVALTPTVGDEVVKLNKLRQITAQRTSQSKQQVPHFYVTLEVDVEAMLSLREQFETEGSGKVSINDFVLKACVLALQDMPQVNAVYNGDSLLVSGAVNIGMAVAIADGLTVPVIKNAHEMTLRQLAAKTRELAEKARLNKLTPDELQGSTFSVSNMGMLKVDNFIAIINQPNAAILAVSSAQKKVVVDEDDEIAVRTRMNITLSFDHRVVDGAIGAKFANIIREYLQNPTRLLS